MWSRIAHSGRSVAGKFLLLNLVVLAVVLCAVGAVSVRVSTDEFGNLRGQRMIAVAENVASTPIVRDQLDNRDVGSVLAPEVDRAVNLSGADLAEIVGPDGVVLVSSDPTRIGADGELGPSDAATGRAWSGDLDIAGAHSIVGHVPVLDVDGDVLAVVSVSDGYPSVWELLTDGGAQLLLYLGIGAALGLVGSYLLARRLDRDTRGLEVAEIASLADHREALLHSIREGVVAVDNEGEITVLNDSAQELLGLPDDAVGRRVDDVGLDPAVRDFLLSESSEHDVVISTGDRVLALNRQPASSRGQRIGTVTTMRDSTELASMQSQLTSHKSVTDTLRAQTHEFANQLHTISGLTQLGEFEAVTELIGTLTRRRAEISDAVTRRITDPAVAALLIAKTTLAAESGVALELTDDSRLAALDPALSTDVITILGNLIDNAVDVSEGSAGAKVTVRVTDRDGLLIEVADTGPGVPPDARETIFARGVTSKPDVPGGRGVGLALVRLVSTQHGGSVAVTDTETDCSGALFTVRLPHSAVGAGR
ncbi:MAG TPA: sensor histidine kinase [Aldersonia sp.]